MNDRMGALLIGFAVLALAFYVFIGPLDREDLDKARTTVRQEVREQKERLDNSFDAAKQDLNRIAPPQPVPDNRR